MIPPWERALDQAANQLGSDGELHVVDFGGCEGLPSTAKAGLYAWLAKFRVTPREDLERALGELARRHRLDLAFVRLYRGYSYYAVLRRGRT